jgi:hypothetical protein
MRERRDLFDNGSARGLAGGDAFRSASPTNCAIASVVTA